MAVALAINSVDKTRRKRIIEYIPTFSGTYATNGDTLNLLTATDPKYLPYGYPGQEVPERIEVHSQGGGVAFQAVIGATNGVHKLKVFQLPNLTSVYAYSPGAGDIKGATNLAGTEGNADQNAAPVNSILLKALATFTALAGTATPTTQPGVPRNVVITIANDSGGSLNLYEGKTTFTITGTNVRGTAMTETVELTSTSGNKAIANTKFRFVQGVKAFASVTSVTWDNAPDGGLKLSLGIGTRFGLPMPLQAGVYGDVLKVTVNAANVAPSATVANAGGVDTTNNTVNSGTIADGDDVFIEYNAATASANVPLAEYPNATAYPAALLTDDAQMRIVAVFPL